MLQYDDESQFSHVSFSGPQFRYKTRVYKQTNLDEKALSKLSTKVFLTHVSWTLLLHSIHFHSLTSFLFYTSQASLKKFLDYIQTGAVEKMTKVLDKGLDPNFHDPDTGGEFGTTLCTVIVEITFLKIHSLKWFSVMIWNSIRVSEGGLSFSPFYLPPPPSVGQRPRSLCLCSQACRWRASGCWFRAVLIWILETEKA